MPEGIGSIRPVLIPSYGEAADIQAAFKLYHYGSTSQPASVAAASATSMVGLLRDSFNNPTVTSGTFIGPSVTGGTFVGPSVTGGTFVAPTIINPSVTSGTFNTPTIVNPSITSGTFNTPTIVNPTVTSGTFITPTIATPSITGTITITSASPTISGTNVSAASIFTSTVTGVTIGSSSIRTVEFPADATTSTAAVAAGYMGMPQNSTTTGAYRLVLADAGKHIYSTATRTITIPGNTTGGTPLAPFPIGSTIVFANAAAVTLTLQMDATTTDTCILANVGTSMTGGSGSRTLAANGMCTLLKVTSTSWIITGNGLT